MFGHAPALKRTLALRQTLTLKRVLAALLGWCAAVSGAAADWVRAESENFVFHGKVAPERARETVRELEVFRSTVLALMGADGAVPEVRKVHVFGERDVRGVRRLTGMRGVSGVYTKGDDYPVFVTLAGGRRRQADSARMVALHELTHHILAAHTARFYPRWYDEGFAEYLSSFTLEGDLVTVGEPASAHGLILNRRGWTDADLVFGSVAAYPFESGGHVQALRAGYFYGMSWLGVHYLMNTPDLGRRIDDYVTLVNAGVEPIRAFEEGFGLTPSAFRKRIHAYWQKNAFGVAQFRLGEGLAEPAVTVAVVPEAEARAARFEAEALFRHEPDDLERTRRAIEDALTDEGPSGRLYAHLLRLSLHADDHDGAVAVGRRAVAALPDDADAIQTLADALFHRYLAAPGSEKRAGDLTEAITLFERQLTIAPDSPTANLHLPTATILAGAAPSQTVVDAVAFNLAYRRAPSNFGIYLDGAAIMQRLGADVERCGLVAVVAPWIRAADAALDDEQRAKRRGETPLDRLDRLGEGCPAG